MAEALVSTVQGIAGQVLVPPPYNGFHMPRMVINAHRSALQGENALLILLRKLCQMAVHGILQHLLHIQINGCINPVPFRIKAFLALPIEGVIFLLILGFFLLRGKFRLELEPLLAHQRTDSAEISICFHIVVFCLFRAVQGNHFCLGLAKGFLADFPILQHLV